MTKIYRIFPVFLIFGCAGQLGVKNFTFCADAGISGAACDQFLTDHQVILTKSEWDAERFGWICTSPSDYSNIKAEIEQACSELHCNYDQTITLEKFFNRVSKAENEMKK